jgi:hypothetical protein
MDKKLADMENPVMVICGSVLGVLPKARRSSVPGAATSECMKS